MFEQTFVTGGARGRSPAAIAISVGGQTLIVGCLLLLPLLQPQAMHYVLQRSSLALPVRSIPQEVKISRTQPRGTNVHPVFRASALQAPKRVPQRIAMITDAAPDLGLPATTSPSATLNDGFFGGLSEVAKPVPALPAPVEARKPASRVRVSSSMQQALLIQQVKPAYPALARSARISGAVTLQAIISKDGTIQKLQVVSGHPLLTQAALSAVAQWRYRPTLLGGEPVEVSTQIQVNFVLSQ